MKQDIAVPAVGESVSKGTISSWLKADGQRVREGEELFELETDKATLAIPSPASGVLTIGVGPGSEVEIGQVVARIDTDDAAPLRAESPRTGRDAPEAARPEPSREPSPAASPGVPEPPKAAPAEPAAAKAPPARAVHAGEQAARGPSPAVPPDARTKRVKMSAIRRLTAEKLVRSKQVAAHLTTFNEIDMTRVGEIRKAHGLRFEQAHGVKLGLMSFFVKACCAALKEFPEVNAAVDGDDIAYNDFYDLGVAVSTDRGLLVPVLRDADRLGFADIERAIRGFAERARGKKLSPDELAGGTFTITNGGVFGSLLSTPIPNPPQAAILGMHVVQSRPVVVGDLVVPRPMMYVALTYDHRIIDGRGAVGFLVRVKQLVEDPERLVLGV